MSRILLVSTNIASDPYPVYPLGMAVIASALDAQGHMVRQFDLLIANDTKTSIGQALSDFSPDYIGISLRNLDNVDSFTSDREWYLDDTKGLIQEIRNKTAAPIIIGGPGFSLMPEETLNYTEADYGIAGEGEKVMCDLIHSLNEGQQVPTIMNGNSTNLNGDQMPSPIWEETFIDFYLKHSAMVSLQTKRGCPYSCTYCSYPTLEGRHFRIRDVGAVVDDIERLNRRYGVEKIFFTDSVFNDPAGHYLEIAEEVLAREIEICWYAFFRPTGIGSEEMKLLKRSGLGAMEVGTDAASDATLAALNKRFSFGDVVEFHRTCLEEKIPVAHYVIFGGPGETVGTVKKGLKNIERLQNCVVFAFSGIRIHPDTKLFERSVEEGLLSKRASLLRPVYYFSPELEIASMNSMIKDAFSSSRRHFFPPSEGLLRKDIMNRLGYQGLLWDRLISFPNSP